MEIQQHQNPLIEMVHKVEKDVKKIEHPFAEIEHKTGHLEESLEKKADEKELSVEENVVDQILKSPNTEKLLEYIANHPRTKKICEDIAEEKVEQLKKELTEQIKNIENKYSQDADKMISIGKNIAYASAVLGIIIIAHIAMKLYS